MAQYSLSLTELDLAAEAPPLSFPAQNAMLYVAEGSVALGPTVLPANSAYFCDGDAALRAAGGGARILCFDLASGAAPPAALLASAVALDPAGQYLMRCDRVDFPPGGVAYTHTHRGPGIRRLLKGNLTVETEGHVQEIAPGGAWFESGPAPVLATASKTEETAFVRVMVLPRALLGKSSIRYVRPEDADKPKLQRYTVFQDVPISLRGG